MKDFLIKILSGFGVGLGFAVAAVAVIYFSSELLMKKVTKDAYAVAEEEMPKSFGYKSYSKDSGLSIKSHKEREIKHGMEVLAEIENNGDTTWSSVSLEVELFNSKGEFIDECSGYLQGKLAPGEVENVKVKCGGCKDNPLAAYDSYTIDISNASSFEF